MSSSQKRPAARRRTNPNPVPGGGQRPTAPSASAPSSSTNPSPPEAIPSAKPTGGGLLGSIIGGIKRDGLTKKAAIKDGASVVTAADVETREARLMRARKDFEKKHSQRMKDELIENPSTDPEQCIEFEPMEKIWRNILHELAGDLHLHAESIELENPSAAVNKYVMVYKKPPVVELTEAEEARRVMNLAASKAAGKSGVKKGQALTDMAPVFRPGIDIEPELKVVGTVKRDLRGVAQTFDDMKKRKREEGKE